MTERVLRLVNRRARGDEHAEWESPDLALLSGEGGARQLRRELDRSRRFGHEFVLLRMRRVVPDGNGGTDLARSLPMRVRSIDSVWGDRKHAFVLLPEAGREVAEALVTRLRRETPGLIPEDIRLAAFPADGLTGGALLELLERPAPTEQLDAALQQQLASA